MASAASINAKVEQLARSFIPDTTAPAKARRHVEHFLRTVRHHNYPRTNQFEVRQRLIGLEEKFQVLNHDGLSDALRERRLLLAQQHHEPWLPEALYLLLELSENPTKRDALSSLSQLDRSVAVVPVLKWADIEGDEPFTRQDHIWQQPDFGDFGSDEDDFIESSPAVSPEHRGGEETSAPISDVVNSISDVLEPELDPDVTANLIKNKLTHRGGDSVVVLTDIQAMREALFMVQGLPTALFNTAHSSQLQYRLGHLHDQSFNSVLQAVIEIGTPAREIRTWLQHRQSSRLMQTLQSSVQEVISTFDRALNGFHQRLLQPGTSGVASLLALVDSIRKQAAPVITVRNLLRRVHGRSPVDCLDAIHTAVSSTELASDSRIFLALLKIFQAVFKTYTKSLEAWVSSGALDQDDDAVFFISRAKDHHDKSALWPDWFIISTSASEKAPRFLADLADRILVAGKSRVFLRHLNHRNSHRLSPIAIPTLSSIIDHVCTSTRSSLLPFAPTLYSCIDAWLTSHLSASSATLQTILRNQLNLDATICSMSKLYFSSNSVGHLTDSIDSDIFGLLDHASPSWNDSIRLTDVYASSLGQTHDFDASRVTISSKTMPHSRLLAARRSVAVLSTLHISYTLPWTIANILIPSVTEPSYQRISVFLRQIRRAQYCLRRHALPALQSLHRGDHGLRSSIRVSAGRVIRPLRITEGVFLLLHTFTSTLYAHMTDCVIDTMGQRFRARLADRGNYGTRQSQSRALMIDDTIRLHQSHVEALEMACLTAPTRNISLVRATILEILDLCLAFSLGIAKSPESQDDDDDEAEEEARSRGVDDGLGVSVKEMMELKRKARRAVDLLIAGLRGSSRRSRRGSRDDDVTGEGDEEACEMIDLLARRLELCQLR